VSVAIRILVRQNLDPHARHPTAPGWELNGVIDKDRLKL
jgi:hypothetical protein